MYIEISPVVKRNEMTVTGPVVNRRVDVIGFLNKTR